MCHFSWGKEKRIEERRIKKKRKRKEGGYPLHKLYLTAPAGARLLAHEFTVCAVHIIRVAIQDATRSGVERPFHSTG